MAILDRALRMGEAKQFRQFEKRVARINDFEPELELETMDELRERTDSLREQAHAVRQCSAELSRQVKRDRDKRRRRREARAAGPQPAL